MNETEAEHVREYELAKSKRKTRKRGVKFCPKRGLADVFWALVSPQLWSILECKSCGWRGTFIIENGKLAEKLRAEYARRNVKK